LVKQSLSNLDAQWVEQKEQLGTGHAVLQADNLINNDDTVLILYGDVPLLTKHSIEQLLGNVTKQSLRSEERQNVITQVSTYFNALPSPRERGLKAYTKIDALIIASILNKKSPITKPLSSFFIKHLSSLVASFLESIYGS
jgi:NDP-sugar pyrophosphorylase family protein